MPKEELTSALTQAILHKRHKALIFMLAAFDSDVSDAAMNRMLLMASKVCFGLKLFLKV